MAATATALHLLKAGNHILCIDDVYGGTQRYFRLVSSYTTPAKCCLGKAIQNARSFLQVAKPTYGMDVTFVDMSDPAEVARAIRVDPTGGPASTKMIWVETPTNPT